MRKFLLAATSCATLLSTNPASAATLLFDFVSVDPADSFSFSLDSNPTPFFDNSMTAIIETTFNTSAGPVDGNVAFMIAANGGGFATFVPGFFFPEPVGEQLFTGTTADPTFAPGVFELNFFNGLAPSGAVIVGPPAGTLTISETMAAVPEPGTWLMMILGFGAIGASMRRRQQNTTLAVSYS
jgi:hypothetical protein